MAGETLITVVGNLTADPELRTTGNGSTVVNFTVASTPRSFNRNSGQWEDGDSLFMRCSCWDSQYTTMASNIASSLTKGMRVIVQGNLTQRSYQTREGETRTIVELRVSEVGPALSRATAQVNRVASTGGFQGNQGGFAGATSQGYQPASAPNYSNSMTHNAAPAVPASDPWSSSEDATSFGSYGSSADYGMSDDPEF